MPVALTIEGLEVDFGGFKAVDGMTTVIDEGELRVVLGPNGAGKTTLMDLISGKTSSTAGQVRLFGRDITNRPEHQIARAGVGRKFQIPSVFRELTVHDNLRVAVSHDPSVFRNLHFGMARRDIDRIDEVIELTGLEPVLDVFAGDLSHGQMQWLELGMLITQQSKVILLDEPTAGMTQAETSKTADIILRMKGSHTLLVVEHDMGFVKKIAERVTVMHLGKLLAEGPMAKIEQDTAVRDAYLGSGGLH